MSRPLDELEAFKNTEIELFSIAGHDGFLREVNEGFARLLGSTSVELDGVSLLELSHPADIAAVVGALAQLEGGAREVLVENRFRQRDGGFVHLQWAARPLAGTKLWWAVGRDTSQVHELLLAETNLRARLNLALGTATTAMWELQSRTGRFSWEPQAGDVLGVEQDALPETIDELAALVDPTQAASIFYALREQLPEAGGTETTIAIGDEAARRHLSLRGTVIDRDARGRAVRAVGLLVDVSTEHAMQEQLLRMVMSDPLTGVANRRAFEQLLRSEWRKCTRTPCAVSAVMIDIDNFKQLNDRFGHLVGDDVLCAVARALSGAAEDAQCSLARFGGEEFALVVPEKTAEEVLRIARRMVEVVREVTVTQAKEWSLTVSVGTASWQPGDPAVKATDLLARADKALYAAKAAGKDRAVGHGGATAQPAA